MRLFVRRKAAKPRERGFVLIVVIWAIGLLALIATSFALSVRSHVRGVAAVQDVARAEALADAGANLAILDLVTTAERKSRERRFPVDGTQASCVSGAGDRLIVVIEDEYGKVDVNMANPNLIGALLKGLGVEAAKAEALTDAIIDFRDADNERRPHGAEAPEYVAEGRLYRPKNLALDVSEELQQVLGMDAELYTRMRPFLTVYSGQTGIDPGVASRQLLTVLSNVFPPIDTIGSGGTDPVLSDARPRLSLPPGGTSASGKRFYTVRAVAVMKGGTVFVREALVELGAQWASGHALRRWRRGALPLAEPRPDFQDQPDLPEC